MSTAPGPIRHAVGTRAGAVWHRWRSRVACERGSFTAELAAGLPALMLLLVAGLTAVNAVGTRVACVDAAREAALAAARGEPGTMAGTRYAPDGAEVTVTVAGDRVTATVRAPVRTLGAGLPRLVVSGEAVAAVEPGAPGPVP
ncbi:hypothetical protein GA0070562_1565 [Micromonospora tulbaghiae]|uniref:Mucin-associated surface protein n=1 Tax=Micromonospora tulbaghiae TaxID=479978 RepID=A0ABY0KFX3_9ACTN|nr:hypothetical protein GA0070562_1565 [Micromonospora tulbaghiae]